MTNPASSNYNPISMKTTIPVDSATKSKTISSSHSIYATRPIKSPSTLTNHYTPSSSIPLTINIRTKSSSSHMVLVAPASCSSPSSKHYSNTEMLCYGKFVEWDSPKNCPNTLLIFKMHNSSLYIRLSFYLNSTPELKKFT